MAHADGVVGARVISFQVETGEKMSKHDFDAAIKSIEAVRFNMPAQQSESAPARTATAGNCRERRHCIEGSRAGKKGERTLTLTLADQV
jgi:hypothetical protein